MTSHPPYATLWFPPQWQQFGSIPSPHCSSSWSSPHLAHLLFLHMSEQHDQIFDSWSILLVLVYIPSLCVSCIPTLLSLGEFLPQIPSICFKHLSPSLEACNLCASFSFPPFRSVSTSLTPSPRSSPWMMPPGGECSLVKVRAEWRRTQKLQLGTNQPSDHWAAVDQRQTDRQRILTWVKWKSFISCKNNKMIHWNKTATRFYKWIKNLRFERNVFVMIKLDFVVFLQQLN